MPPANNPKSYVAEFDALRAFAVIAVMVRHYYSHHEFLVVLGTAGVSLFFVLSGFLITRILVYEKNKFELQGFSRPGRLFSVLKVFYIRRTLRIFPLYYLVLIILVLLNIDSVREYWYYYFFYYSNHIYSDHFVIDRLSHFWSLAVEEQFYLGWPLLIFLIPFRWIKIPFFVVLTVLSQAFIFYSMFVAKDQGWYNIMPSCVQSFALGAIAMLLQGKKIPSRYLNILMAVMVLIALFIASLPFLATSTLTLQEEAFRLSFDRMVQSILFATFLVLIVNGNYISFFRWVLNNKILLLLGKVSYGIYVYHMFVPGMMVWLFDKLNIDLPGNGLTRLIDFLVTFGISYISFYLFEQPINKLKKKFAY